MFAASSSRLCSFQLTEWVYGKPSDLVKEMVSALPPDRAVEWRSMNPQQSPEITKSHHKSFWITISIISHHEIPVNHHKSSQIPVNHLKSPLNLHVSRQRALQLLCGALHARKRTVTAHELHPARGRGRKNLGTSIDWEVHRFFTKILWWVVSNMCYPH
jgi:hypothetical protein